MLLVDKNIGAVLDINNKVIIQWGSVSFNGSNTSTVLTLPTTYSSTSYKGVSNDVGSAMLDTALGIKSNSQINLYISRNSSKLYWITCGY